MGDARQKFLTKRVAERGKIIEELNATITALRSRCEGLERALRERMTLRNGDYTECLLCNVMWETRDDGTEHHQPNCALRASTSEG